MIIVYSTYSSELFQEINCMAETKIFFCSAYSSELFLKYVFGVPIFTLFCSAYSSELFHSKVECRRRQEPSAPLTLLSCFGRTAQFFKVQLAKKTQLLLMHSYYMAYSCINCQILLHRIILTCSFSSANPTAILWVLNVRTPW